MKKIIILGAVALIASVAMLYPSGSWRYRITVSVETPEGIKTGSSVREVTVQQAPRLTPEMNPIVRIKGEAVVVDMGQRGVLFALLSGPKLGGSAEHAMNLPRYIFPFSGGDPYRSEEGLRYYSTLRTSPKELEPEWYPMFVHFGDVKDPITAEKLVEMEECPGQRKWPKKLCVKNDYFEEIFGEGVKLKSVTIEMTSDAVTWGIKDWLPWLPDYYNKMLDGLPNNTSKSKHPFANSLTSGLFSARDNFNER